MNMEMDKALALKALTRLDEKLLAADFPKIVLAVGGGGSMILQHGYIGGTTDIDAVPINGEFEPLKPYMEQVAKELKIAADWLNPHYSAYTIYLPSDAKSRMMDTFIGNRLVVRTLGPEDVLLMKLMAGRAKDMGHIRHLLSRRPNLAIVEKRLDELLKLYPKLAAKALDLLDELGEGKIS